MEDLSTFARSIRVFKGRDWHKILLLEPAGDDREDYQIRIITEHVMGLLWSARPEVSAALVRMQRQLEKSWRGKVLAQQISAQQALADGRGAA